MSNIYLTRNNLVLLLFIACLGPSFAQKKVINHEVYNDWKSLTSPSISDNGKYISYEIKPHQGDGELFLYDEDQLLQSFSRGKKAVFSANNDALYFQIDPGFDTLRTLKLEKVKKEKWVKDTLAIYLIAQDSLLTFPDLKSFKYAERGEWIAFLEQTNDPVHPKVEKKKRWWRRKKEEPKKPSSDGNRLTILHPFTGEKIVLNNVKDMEWNAAGTSLMYTTHLKIDKKDSMKLFVYHTESKTTLEVPYRFTDVGNFAFDYLGEQLTFLASQDTVSKNKLYDLYVWKMNEEQPILTIDTLRADLPKGMTVSNHRKPYFSRNGERLYLGLKEIPAQEPKDTLLDSEKATLDLWHFQDKQLQPQQLKQQKREENKTLLSVLHLKDNVLIQLESDTLTVRLSDFGNSDFALGTSNESYSRAYNWAYPWASDYYRVNVNTGERELLVRNVAYDFGLSPTGKYFVYFDSQKNRYLALDNDTKHTACLTCLMPDTAIVWTTDVNGMPHDPYPFGTVGYTKGDKSLIIHSEYDVWEADMSSSLMRSITRGRGKETEVVLRLHKWNRDSTYVDLSETYVHGVEQRTKDEHLYRLEPSRKEIILSLSSIHQHKLTGIQKAKKGDHVIYRKMNVQDYPELYLTDVNLREDTQISSTNPQQEEYIWPTVELMSWTSPLGKELEGLIYKPEDFDSTKSYPMLVYFYELYADRKHQHYIPKPTASIIFATEYTSAGYVVFMPDIRYDPGYPARGAYDCIMSGTDEVLTRYPNIDSSRMGLQGQSWGGYQTAQLITMTNRYKAAMAGAPVSNMFSAYGGIRWGSGLNRQFQYERSQSRIGKTIWEAPELYTENSPLFGLPQVETPLLIMHNDQDGAVPWYQGIELFTGLKRLNKPTWLLNYNGDDHNLMQNANRIDLSIRMRQFFDYYLQDQPAPEWLIHGIPAIEKGKDYRLELIEED